MMNWNTSTDCCNWNGVTCDRSTGDVIGIDISCGMLNGTIHPNSSLFNLPHLQKLNLAYNYFDAFEIPSEIGSGNVPFESFALPSLKRLDLDNNQLRGQIDLQTFGKLTNLIALFLSFNNFSGKLELDALLSSLTNLEYLDLSYSGLSITTNNANHYVNPGFLFLKLASCKLKAGEIGRNELYLLNFSHNFITVLPQFQWYGLEELYLQSNLIEGLFPPSICNMSSLRYLDMSHNSFDGVIPQCVGNINNSLQMMGLGFLSTNQTTFMETFDPSFAVKFPFPGLQVVDLSHNGFVGQLPTKYFQNFVSMENVVKNNTEPQYLYMGGKYYSFVVAFKGVDRDIPRLFVSLTIIDLSNNYFERGIPEIIGNLRALKVLNLSHNSLNGRIPDSLGKLSEIESLDLSWNQLIGNIPQSLAGIKGLEVLNLSQNHLVGRIPGGTQFKTFDESSFAGNLALCGFPLPKKCSEPTHKPQFEEDEDKNGFTWEVVTLGYGCGTLLGLVMGYLSRRKVKWFNLIADAGEHMILERNKRRYVEECGEASDLFSYSDVYQLLVNCCSAIRQFAYGSTADAFDEYLQMSEHTARDALFFFNMCIIELYMPKYLKKPTSEDVVNIHQKHNNVHGFPGMLESIDCMH
nr:leucine-rich repeat-containing protein [Tanacetum cinerariifolium]